MHIFARLFHHAPRDDSLLNMLCDNAAHMAIDNQASQILRFATRNTQYAVGLDAAKRHAQFIQHAASALPTWNILTRDLEPDTDDDAYHRRVLKELGVGYSHVAYDDNNFRITGVDNGSPVWVDSFNADIATQFVAFKNDDDAFSCLSRSGPALVTEMKKYKSVLLSGFFAELCVPRTAHGAHHNRLGRLIIDPDQIYSVTNFAPVSAGRAADYMPFFGTTITAPGQVAHVLGLGPSGPR